MAGIDMNRTTAGADQLLPREISQEIWSKAIEESTVMQLANQVSLPAGGVTIPVVTGDPEAAWVNETDEIRVDEHTLDVKQMQGYKMGIIEPFSKEFRRDLPGLYTELSQRLPKALGTLFDRTVLHGNAPGSNFDTLTAAPSVTLDGTDLPGDYLNAYTTVALAGGDLSGWALSPQAEAQAMGARDAQGNFLFIPNAQDGGVVGRIFGRPVTKSKGVYRAAVADDPATTGTNEAAPAVLGFAGDFSSARFGYVEGISVSVTDQASINRNGTLLHLWQRDMFALKVTVEIGFITRDPAHFVRLVQG